MKINSNISIINNYSNPHKSRNAKPQQKLEGGNFSDNIPKAHSYLLSFNGLNYKKVDFKEAKTLEEAENFGKNFLGIMRYSSFDNKNDIGMLNYINEGLCKAYNLSKGKIKMPIFVKASSLGNAFATMNATTGTLEINKDKFSAKNIDTTIDLMFNTMLDDKVILIKNDDYILNPKISTNETKEFFKKINEALIEDPSDLSYNEKLELMLNLRLFYNKTSIINKFPTDLVLKMLKSGSFGKVSNEDISKIEKNINYNPSKSNFFHLFDILVKNKETNFNFDLKQNKHNIIFHELGHLQDSKLANLPIVMDFSNPKDYSDELLEWLNNPCNLEIASKVSPYSCCGVPEFIAEVYEQLLSNKELPSDVIELYNNFNGPKTNF